MEARAGFGAQSEALVFLECFADFPDTRQRGKVVYPLAEVLLLCLLAVLGGAETFVDIARFGEKKLGLLRRFRPFRDGTPSHDHLGDIFAALDAEAFQRCFVAWAAALTGAPKDVIAIDGKTLRRSYQKKGAKAPIHMVSAFAARQRLVLGQVKVAEKSNEIVAIPALLDMMAIEGAIVTIDAMGCQRDIAQKILDKKADYVLALKGNQSSLREEMEFPGHRDPDLRLGARNRNARWPRRADERNVPQAASRACAPRRSRQGTGRAFRWRADIRLCASARQTR